MLIDLKDETVLMRSGETLRIEAQDPAGGVRIIEVSAQGYAILVQDLRTDDALVLTRSKTYANVSGETYFSKPQVQRTEDSES